MDISYFLPNASSSHDILNYLCHKKIFRNCQNYIYMVFPQYDFYSVFSNYNLQKILIVLRLQFLSLVSVEHNHLTAFLQIDIVNESSAYHVFFYNLGMNIYNISFCFWNQLFVCSLMMCCFVLKDYFYYLNW